LINSKLRSGADRDARSCANAHGSEGRTGQKRTLS
jgi:hypothetical protein